MPLINHLAEFIARIDPATQKAVSQTAQQVADMARSTVAVETGAARAAIFVIAPGIDTYDAAASEALSLDPKGKIIDRPEDPSENGAIIGTAIDHGVYLELGTYKMAAQPYLAPAAEGMDTTLASMMTDALGA